MFDPKEIFQMKDMVRWFDPSVLFKVIKPVIISGIFGDYADRRLIHAALDACSNDNLISRADIRSSFNEDKDGSIWFDYTADTGDGFDSTYTIASLIARPTLSMGACETRRGDLLVLGGDQVYPDASYESYFERFRKPYKWAFPDQTDISEEKHPLMYAIPGNHDWYDGLDLFLALFCKKRSWSVGNWRTPQQRSYFALRLSNNWWLWGVDIQLSERIDQPQEDYFDFIASKMPEASNLIICTAAPGWLYGSSTHNLSYQSLGYVAGIAHRSGKDIRIPLVLSGDTHHYSRYKAEHAGTQFVTAGGGGAFLHPTHQLKEKMTNWWIGRNETIRLEILQTSSTAEKPLSNDSEAVINRACYPSQDVSKKLLQRNLTFAFRNKKFSAILGGSYSIFGLLILMWTDVSTLFAIVTNPVWWAVFGLHGLIYVFYANDAEWVFKGKTFEWMPQLPKIRKFVLGFAHASAHVIALTALSGWLFHFAIFELGLEFWTLSFNAYFATAMTILGGLTAGTIFGLYLYIACLFLGAQANDAFSALSLDSYKHFLRIRIKGDELFLYPIGIDQVPSREKWEPNPVHKADPSQPVFTSKCELQYRLIEGPIKMS